MGATRTRVGILWRGPRGATRPAEDRVLGPLFDELTARRADVVPVPFGDERVDEVRAELSTLDALLVWVNPIQDGATRAHLDDVLAEAARSGVWVSAHPDVVRTMGTKQVLVETRELAWGSDTELYRSIDELAARLPERLDRHGRLVVKQGRGNGGNGVWSVEPVAPGAPLSLGAEVLVHDARAPGAPPTRMSLGEFVEGCAAFFAWSGVLVDQPYQRRLAEGMVRCYFSHDEVVGFRRQWPKGLLPPDLAASLFDRASVVEGPDAPAYQSLRRQAEGEWVPEMARVLGLGVRDLPVIWDADVLFATAEEPGEERYVLCEINVSAVWPYPPTATRVIAQHTLAATAEAAGR